MKSFLFMFKIFPRVYYYSPSIKYYQIVIRNNLSTIHTTEEEYKTVSYAQALRINSAPWISPKIMRHNKNSD